ncbi:hypothetical protein HYPGJ_21002 [Hyphomicrobium sp. GJ21]|nr:hypothetical protein HYPGJ_21002 [Hyphomicrobium sp. GJ21]
MDSVRSTARRTKRIPVQYQRVIPRKEELTVIVNVSSLGWTQHHFNASGPFYEFPNDDRIKTSPPYYELQVRTTFSLQV